MPRRPEPAAALAGTLTLVLALVLGGCSAADRSSGSTERGRLTTHHTATPPAVAGVLERLLDRRAAAVRAVDATAFRRGLDGSDPAFVARQEAWLGNLAQLPVADLRYVLDPRSLVRHGRSYRATVTMSLRLTRYDAAPVVSRARYRFAPDRGRLRLTSVGMVAPQPWDLGPVQVREGHGVLAVLDAGSAARADGVVRAVERGIGAIAPRVPLPWDRRVVVYALSGTAFLESLSNVPGGDPLAVDALTFPVMGGPDARSVAATRFVLSPRLLAQDGPARDRLIRHVLVHVALGEHDDRIPVWLSEGLAEYLSVRDVPPSRRAISGEALSAARAGLTELPADATFNGPQSSRNYGVAWWVCEAIVDRYGEPMLWSLVDTLGTSDVPDRDLELLLDTREDALVRRAGDLMLATYEEAGPPA
jgi:hypothetical protein